MNPRGQGVRLRREVLDAAAALLAEEPAAGGVTLRAIARRAGVAAPSIYAHFPDRDAVLDTVVAEAFEALAADLGAAAAGVTAPADQLRAVCAAYLAFAADNPGRYRLLFGRSSADVAAEQHPYDAGLAAFAHLARALKACIEDGSSTSRDAHADAVAVWTYLHGLVLLPPATPGFPWPDTAALLGRVAVLAHVRQAPSRRRPDRSMSRG